MGHYREFSFVLRATAAYLDMLYRPLCRIWLYAMGHCAEGSRTVKICNDSHATVCAKAQYLFMRFGPQRSIWFCAMGRSAGFGYALWAIAQDLVLCFGL
jgi:hypothetical protein